MATNAPPNSYAEVRDLIRRRQESRENIANRMAERIEENILNGDEFEDLVEQHLVEHNPRFARLTAQFCADEPNTDWAMDRMEDMTQRETVRIIREIAETLLSAYSPEDGWDLRRRD